MHTDSSASRTGIESAPADGKIAQILVQNAQPVEFGEVLVVIE